jgi:hypothetical protein
MEGAAACTARRLEAELRGLPAASALAPSAPPGSEEQPYAGRPGRKQCLSVSHRAFAHRKVVTRVGFARQLVEGLDDQRRQRQRVGLGWVRGNQMRRQPEANVASAGSGELRRLLSFILGNVG